MVNIGNTLSSLLAFTVGYNATAITEEWVGEGSDLTPIFDLGNTDSMANVAAKAASSVIIATFPGIDNVYNFVAESIRNKSDETCLVSFVIDSDGSDIEGYAYEVTTKTTGSGCETTADKETILAAVKKCANTLDSRGVVRGCCKFAHGGTWQSQLRLTREPDKYPAGSITC